MVGDAGQPLPDRATSTSAPSRVYRRGDPPRQPSVDLGPAGTYTGFKNWKLTLGVKNLFDTDPPFTNQQNTFQLGYDPTYYDARARFVYGS